MIKMDLKMLGEEIGRHQPLKLALVDEKVFSAISLTRSSLTSRVGNGKPPTPPLASRRQ